MRALVGAPRGLCLAVVALGLLVPGRQAESQGTCQVNNQTVCALGNTATYALSLTVTAAVRLQTTATSVTIPTPTGSDFDAVFGSPASLGITVRSNRAWVLSIRSTNATWTGVGAEARLGRPVADLQWATLVGGPFTNLSTTSVTLVSGVPTGNAISTVFLRARYAWNLDTPGSYTLPVQLTLTAP